jgi:hypothetical protein
MYLYVYLLDLKKNMYLTRKIIKELHYKFKDKQLFYFIILFRSCITNEPN